MKRLAILVMALLACAACLGMAEYGVGQIGPWLQTHMAERWFVYACNVLVFGHGEWITQDGDLRTLPCHLADKGGMDGFYAARLRRL